MRGRQGRTRRTRNNGRGATGGLTQPGPASTSHGSDFVGNERPVRMHSPHFLLLKGGVKIREEDEEDSKPLRQLDGKLAGRAAGCFQWIKMEQRGCSSEKRGRRRRK